MPEFMIPASFTALDHLPLTPNGKVDRARLPAPSPASQQRAYVAPRPGAQTRLAHAWQAVLGVERIGIHDDFFDLGGHSLLAARVVARLRADLGVEVPVRMVFEHPTIAELADALPTASGTTAPPIARQPRRPYRSRPGGRRAGRPTNDTTDDSGPRPRARLGRRGRDGGHGA
jgi:hypothetical protein